MIVLLDGIIDKNKKVLLLLLTKIERVIHISEKRGMR
jgi:hypothetical protein